MKDGLLTAWVPVRLRDIQRKLDAIECTRGDGYHCRTHYDTDLCPPCAVALELDRLYWEVAGRWMDS